MDIEAIRSAATGLSGVAAHTPMLSKSRLNDLFGAEIFLKCENLQLGGSFKLRGAYNQMSNLTAEQRKNGVVTFSSGNHGIGVCLAGQLLGIDAIVYLPDDASPSKRRAIEDLGGTTINYDPTVVDRETIAERDIAAGRTLIAPYDHPHGIAGQGTVGLEIATQAPSIDIVLVPAGGGGLLAGIAIAVKSMIPGVRVIGIEPSGADDMRQSREAGARIRIEHPTTIVDSLRTRTPGKLTFPIIESLVDDIVSVDDASVQLAMRDLFDHCNIVAEPGGAVGLAAIREGAVDVAGKQVCIVVSGGNISTEGFNSLMAASI